LLVICIDISEFRTQVSVAPNNELSLVTQQVMCNFKVTGYHHLHPHYPLFIGLPMYFLPVVSYVNTYLKRTRGYSILNLNLNEEYAALSFYRL